MADRGAARPSGSHPPDPWPAPLAHAPIEGTVRVPGSKSQTNRALILAALAAGPSAITGGLAARDTFLMVEALRRVGVAVTTGSDQSRATPNHGTSQDLSRSSMSGPDRRPNIGTSDSLSTSIPANSGGEESSWQVVPAPLRGPAEIDCGLAGTVMRFVPAVAALATGRVAFDGDPGARVRPMRGVLNALRDLGVAIDDSNRGALPFAIEGTGRVRGGSVGLDASASSQFISALLLAGARYDAGVTVTHTGTTAVPSAPHITMTIEMLRQRGVAVTQDRNQWRVAPGPIAAVDAQIEPDLSNAGPFLAAALVTGGRVTIAGWPERTAQPGVALIDLFGRMGAKFIRNASGLTLIGPDNIVGVDVDLNEVGELTPIVAVCAALATSPSRLRGIAHLRGHETDRLRALATELSAIGAMVEEHDDGLSIVPGRLRGALFRTYDDHRMATAGAVLGLVVPGVLVENVTDRKSVV